MISVFVSSFRLYKSFAETHLSLGSQLEECDRSSEIWHLKMRIS